MKKKYLFVLLAIMVCLLPLNAQVSKTINVTTAGTLNTLLTPDELNIVTDLTLTGQINQRDFITMRDNMPVLANIDMKAVTINAYTGDDGTVYASNSIPDNIFYNCIHLTSINLPATLTTIEAGAFFYCSGLTSINFPPTLTSIGYQAFFDCSGLKSINLPATLTTIEAGAFFNCSGLTSINFPATLTSIGYLAFWSCSGLTNITFPATLTTIGYSAFESCSGLTNITFPDALTTIGYSAFEGCSGLTNITFSDALTIIGGSAFSHCYSLTSINLPATLTTVGEFAFSNCGSLTSINLPVTLTTIGAYAFESCSSLSEIKTFSSVPQTITDNVWQDVKEKTCKLIVPKGAAVAYKAALVWKDFTNISEFNPTGIASVFSSRAKAWTADGQVYVSSGEAINKVELISLAGSILSKEQAQKTIYQLNLNHEKVAIVRVTYQDGSSESIKVAENKD